MGGTLLRQLTPSWGMQRTWLDGRPTREAVADFIKPNDRMSAFERLEVYNKQYWFRLLDCLYDDYPGLRAVIGDRKFLALRREYLARHPSDTFALRDLGSQLINFIAAEPQLTTPRTALALEMARFEWAQVVAFDSAAKKPVTVDDLLDQPPEKLRLALQPYLTLLELNHAVDEFFRAVKKRDSDILRSESSNAVGAEPKEAARPRRVAPPRRQKIFLAVHRNDNHLYYKRLEPEAFAILCGLRDGQPLAAACESAILASQRECNWEERITAWFANWSELGWFCRPK